MARPAFTWLLSDTHWYHDAICRPDFENRPIDHMNRVINACKHLVKPQDTLIHLGDVIFYQHCMLKPLLDSFPCRKILTMGNHDKKSRGWYMRNGFDFACDSFDIGEWNFRHIPTEDARCVVQFHGHWHSGRDKPSWWHPMYYRLISLENDGYAPQRITDVLARTMPTVPQADPPNPPLSLQTGGCSL